MTTPHCDSDSPQNFDDTMQIDRREKVRQYNFKRRCAFYAAAMLTLDNLYVVTRAADIAPHVETWLTGIQWPLVAIIAAAMGSEVINSFAGLKK